MNKEDIHLIEDYLSDQLSKAEAEQVKQRAQYDTVFANALAFQKEIQAGIMQWGDQAVKEQIKAIDISLAAEGFFDRYMSFPWWLNNQLLVFLSVVTSLMALGVWTYMANSADKITPSSPPMPKQEQTNSGIPIAYIVKPQKTTTKKSVPSTQYRYYALAKNAWTVPEYSNVRGYTSLLDANVEKAYQAFGKKDFKTVVQLIGNEKDIRSLEMSGHAYFQLNKVAQATTSFQKIVEGPSSPISENAEWFLTLCYVAQHPYYQKEANALLSIMRKDGGHLHHNDALRLRY